MSDMKASLSGLISNACGELRSKNKTQWGDMYAFSLEELQRHIEETVRGEHSLAEFAEYYSLGKARDALALAEGDTQ